MRLVPAIAVLLFAASVTSVNAGPLPWAGLDPDDAGWFYNRPGVAVADMEADYASCRTFAARMMFEDGAPVATQGLVAAAMAEIVSAGPKVSFADDCMMSLGYRRFNVAGENQRQFLARFEAMSAQDRLALVQAETPSEGVLTRQWANDYWITAQGEELAPMPRRMLPIAIGREDQLAWRHWRKIEALENLGFLTFDPSSEAVVLLTLRTSTQDDVGVRFDRADNATGRADLLRVGRRQEYVYFDTFLDGRSERDERAFVYVVPAGTYALASSSARRRTGTQFCLGTIAVTIPAGAIIDMGRIQVEHGGIVDQYAPPPSERLRIDMPTVGDNRGALLGNPPLADQLQNASYVNGFPRVCRLAGLSYGVEMPGAPAWSAPSVEAP